MSMPKRISALAVLLATASALALPAAGAFAQGTELATAVANAKTPADHEAVAKQYDALAAQAESQAALHQKMGANYKQIGGAAIGKYHMDHHCEALVKTAKQEAADYKAMAAAHRAMATQAK